MEGSPRGHQGSQQGLRVSCPPPPIMGILGVRETPHLEEKVDLDLGEKMLEAVGTGAWADGRHWVTRALAAVGPTIHCLQCKPTPLPAHQAKQHLPNPDKETYVHCKAAGQTQGFRPDAWGRVVASS